jgi:hypothetical protein
VVARHLLRRWVRSALYLGYVETPGEDVLAPPPEQP